MDSPESLADVIDSVFNFSHRLLNMKIDVSAQSKYPADLVKMIGLGNFDVLCIDSFFPNPLQFHLTGGDMDTTSYPINLPRMMLMTLSFQGVEMLWRRPFVCEQKAGHSDFYKRRGMEIKCGRSSQKSIRTLMGNTQRNTSSNSWLKDIMLGQRTLQRISNGSSSYNNKVLQAATLEFDLNHAQCEVLQHALTRDNGFSEALQTICLGPSGSGKTHTIIALITCYISTNVAVLIITHTDEAVAKLASRLDVRMKDKGLVHRKNGPMLAWSSESASQSDEIHQSADVVLCTPEQSNERSIELFRAKAIIVDDAARLKGYQVISACARHVSNHSLTKLALFGEHVRSGPHVQSDEVNEFATTAARPYISWQVQRGQPFLTLNTQYRSHPNISSFLNQAFYEGTLEDDSSVLWRPFDASWETFSQITFGTKNRNVFLDVTGDHELYVAHNDSIVNPSTLAVVLETLDAMNNSGQIDIFEDVMVLTFYAAQADLLRRIVAKRFPRKVKICTVDSCGGEDAKIVILDFGRPGPEVGFLGNPERLCVAFSRAAHGLLGVGSVKMRDCNKKEGRGAYILQQYVAFQERSGTIRKSSGDVTTILNLYFGPQSMYRRA
ncbi:MAG: hypothetical protein Q9222_000997 [Ikaeria aurantiellina]